MHRSTPRMTFAAMTLLAATVSGCSGADHDTDPAGDNTTQESQESGTTTKQVDPSTTHTATTQSPDADAAESEEPFNVLGPDRLHVTATWASGTVTLALRSPSGRIIEPDTVDAGVVHEAGPTFETYHIDSPEQGRWAAILTGAQVAIQGEATRLDVYQAQDQAPEPVARIEQVVDGPAVTVDASSSTGRGSIVRYQWEFGDGSTADTALATHTYTEPGSYLVTLAVMDGQGRWAVASAPKPVTVP